MGELRKRYLRAGKTMYNFVKIMKSEDGSEISLIQMNPMAIRNCSGLKISRFLLLNAILECMGACLDDRSSVVESLFKFIFHALKLRKNKMNGLI